LLAQKKIAELQPPGLVVMDRNAATYPQDQKEVPCPLPHILYILFPNNGALLSQKRQVSSTLHEGVLEFFPSLTMDDDHPHRRHSLQL
jgi:hypothetical protein